MSSAWSFALAAALVAFAGCFIGIVICGVGLATVYNDRWQWWLDRAFKVVATITVASIVTAMWLVGREVFYG